MVSTVNADIVSLSRRAFALTRLVRVAQFVGLLALAVFLVAGFFPILLIRLGHLSVYEFPQSRAAVYPVLDISTTIAFAAFIGAYLVRRRLDAVTVQLAHWGAKVSTRGEVTWR